ncbi:MAG: N-6 DNA methylase [Promethearchaeota archaeon]
MLRKKDLVITPNLKSTFERINRHLYARLKHMDTDTRTRSKEIINLLLCKLVDEISKDSEDILDFSIRNEENEDHLFNRIYKFFEDNVKSRYNDIINENEHVGLSANLVYIVVQELQNYSLVQSSKDILSDAFEIFVSKVLKEAGGQFFTPPNIIKFMVNYLDPDIDSKILDPACGHGGFLLEVKDYLLAKFKKEDNDSNVPKIISNICGIDKDSFLVRICRLYLEILSGEHANIFCEDSLDFENYRASTRAKIQEDSYDYIFTNPPFGARIPINNEEILKNYELGHVWKNTHENDWVMQDKLIKKQSPQILFIERCVQLLRIGGKLGIVLPEGIFGNPTNRYIWEYLQKKGMILGVISLDQNTFQPFTCNKTSILFFQKLDVIPTEYSVDFAIVDNIGHDKDGKDLFKLNKDGSYKHDDEGKPIINDDLIDLHIHLQKVEDFNYLKDQQIFKLKNNLIKNKIYIPYYYTGVEKKLKLLEKDKNFELVSIKQLTDDKIIYTNKNGYIPRGDEIGSQVYGLGDIPFIRTSDLNNWEINLNSNKHTSKEVYEKYKKKQNIEVGDILLVKDGGSNLIGKTGYVSDLDTNIIIQSHIFQFKILKNDVAIDPYLILYLLSLEIVQKQIQAITFIQGTIASIGNRIMEVILPLPSDHKRRKQISDYINEIIDSKTKNRKKIRKLSLNTFNE